MELSNYPYCSTCIIGSCTWSTLTQTCVMTCYSLPAPDIIVLVQWLCHTASAIIEPMKHDYMTSTNAINSKTETPSPPKEPNSFSPSVKMSNPFKFQNSNQSKFMNCIRTGFNFKVFSVIPQNQRQHASTLAKPMHGVAAVTMQD